MQHETSANSIRRSSSHSHNMNFLWTTLASRANLTFTESQHALFSHYLDLLDAANQTMNLTRITNRAAAELSHIADALTLLPYLPAGPHRLADIGSGGGVPGIPLAISRPDVQITLIEATKKKAAFLRETTATLDLENVQVMDLRAEDAASGEMRESFDIVTARAVASLDWLAEWCLPLVRKGGMVLAMKGQKITQELPAAEKVIRLLKGGPAVVHPVDLPESEHRVIVAIPKVGKTDARFPRAATAAKGRPLSEFA